MKKYLLFFALFSLVFISCDSDDDAIDRTPSFDVTWDGESLELENFGAIVEPNGTVKISGFSYKEPANENESVDHHYKTRNILITNSELLKGEYSFADLEATLAITDKYYLSDELYKTEAYMPPVDSISEEGSYLYIEEVVTGRNYMSGFFEMEVQVTDSSFVVIEGKFENLHYSHP